MSGDFCHAKAVKKSGPGKGERRGSGKLCEFKWVVLRGFRPWASSAVMAWILIVSYDPLNS